MEIYPKWSSHVHVNIEDNVKILKFYFSRKFYEQLVVIETKRHPEKKSTLFDNPKINS